MEEETELSFERENKLPFNVSPVPPLNVIILLILLLLLLFSHPPPPAPPAAAAPFTGVVAEL